MGYMDGGFDELIRRGAGGGRGRGRWLREVVEGGVGGGGGGGGGVG